jgi:hypothetical protein
MKSINCIKICVLMAFAFDNARADLDRSLSMSDEEINKPYLNKPGFLEYRGANAQRESIKKIEKDIIDTKNVPVDQAIKILGKSIYIIGGYQVAERIPVYDKLQHALLSIPGYGEYCSQRIEESTAMMIAAKNPNVSLPNYDNDGIYIFGLLPELPGPETIKLLGHYLYDVRDLTPNMEGCGLPSEGPHLDAIRDAESRKTANLPAMKLLQTNSFLSSYVLSKIGLRNSQAEIGDLLTNTVEAVDRNRAWWEKVKAGQIPFSFKRQTVEYRFRPDGTWETMQLPISVLEQDKIPATPAQPPSTVRTEKHNLQDPAAAVKTIAAQQVSPASRYALPTLGLVTLLLGIWYFLRSKKVS